VGEINMKKRDLENIRKARMILKEQQPRLPEEEDAFNEELDKMCNEVISEMRYFLDRYFVGTETSDLLGDLSNAMFDRTNRTNANV
jgi:hypothetical protein